MISILCGSKQSNINKLKTEVSELLEVEFRLRDSSFRCGEYWLYQEKDWTIEIIIQLNCFDEQDQEFQEDYPEFPVIMYLSAGKEEAFSIDKLIEEQLPDLKRLRIDE